MDALRAIYCTPAEAIEGIEQTRSHKRYGGSRGQEQGASKALKSSEDDLMARPQRGEPYGYIKPRLTHFPGGGEVR